MAYSPSVSEPTEAQCEAYCDDRLTEAEWQRAVFYHSVIEVLLERHGTLENDLGRETPEGGDAGEAG